jgi:hypothetical protein
MHAVRAQGLRLGRYRIRTLMQLFGVPFSSSRA